MTQQTRRKFLCLTAAGVAAIAGCSEEQGGDTDPDAEGTPPDSGDDTPTPTDTPTQTATATQTERPAFVVLEAEFYNEGQYNWGVRGLAENTSDDVLGYAEVSVTYYDADDTQIAEGLDNWTELHPGRVEFDAGSLETIDPSRIDRYEIRTDWSTY